MQKFEVECTFQKPSLASLRDAHRPGGWEARSQVDAKLRSRCGDGRRWGASSPEVAVSLFCSLTPVVEHRHFVSLNKSCKMLNLQNSMCVRLKKFLFLFFAET